MHNTIESLVHQEQRLSVFSRLLLEKEKAPVVLVGSGLGESSGGGLISFDGEKIDVIDHISSTGLGLADGRLVRLPWCQGDFAAPGELLVYDSLGVERYYRIDTLSDPHDVLWNGKEFVVVSAGQNSIVWVGTNGEVQKVSRFPGEPDSWHLNSLFLHQGELFAAAFGRFNYHREWMQHAGEPCGIIFNHGSGENVVTGLDRPHHPRLVEGNWIICNSGRRELLQVDGRTGTPIRRVQLEKWTRGLAFTDQFIFVGESARRHRPQGDTGAALASIAVLDRSTYSVVDRIPLPFEEVYDLVLVPQPLIEGLRRGFKTNPQRVAERVQHDLFEQVGVKPQQLWATGDLLPREACLAKISVEVESLLASDCFLERPCVVENRGPCIFVSAKPHPVVITYRWMRKDNGRYTRTLSMGTKLPAAVPPGSSISCALKLRTPSKEGLYELHVSLFQKGNGFFMKYEPSNAFKTEIWIHSAGTTAQ